MRLLCPRRASLNPERAQSRPGADGAGLDSSIAAATAAMEQAGGLPEAVHQADVHSAGEVAAAAAAAPFSAVREAEGDSGGGAPAAPTSSDPTATPAADVAAQPMSSAGLPPAPSTLPPMVHVPWQRKPLMHPLSAGDEADPLASPRKPSASSSSCSSGSGEGFVYAAGKGGVPGPGGHTGSGSYTTSFASPHASSQPSGGSRASSAPAGATSQRQQWDLSFEAPALEAGFK